MILHVICERQGSSIKHPVRSNYSEIETDPSGAPSLFTGCWGNSIRGGYLPINYSWSVAANLPIGVYIQWLQRQSSNEQPSLKALEENFLTPSSHFNGIWSFYCLNNKGEMPLGSISCLYAKLYKTFQLLWPPIFFDNKAFSANCVFA